MPLRLDLETALRQAAIIALICNGKDDTMAVIDDITAQIQQAESTEDAAVALLQSLVQQLQDAVNNGNLSQVQVLTNDLKTHTDALASAVAGANPAPGPGPAPAPSPAPSPTVTGGGSNDTVSGGGGGGSPAGRR